MTNVRYVHTFDDKKSSQKYKIMKNYTLSVALMGRAGAKPLNLNLSTRQRYSS